MGCDMKRRGRTVLLCALVWAAVAWAALPATGGAVGVAMLVGRIQQLGPAYPGREISLSVQVRNIGQTECGPCQIRAIGGGTVAIQPLPRIRPGGVAQVIVGGLVFPKPGTYLLTVGVDAPKEGVDFGPKKPSNTFELTVLEGAPPTRGGQR